MSNWQPINSLHDERVSVLMRLPDGSVTVGDRDAYLYRDRLNDYDLGEKNGRIAVIIYPTHWQPFPSGELD